MATKPKLDLSTIGLTGLPVWAGRIYDEELLDLRGDRGRKILREMSEQDPIIGGVLLGIEMLSRQVPWSVTPANDTDKAKEVADFVDECLTDMSPTFGNTLSEILSMLIYGWSWLEIVYKRRQGLDLNDQMKTSRFDDNKVGWGGWAIRSQETMWRWEYEKPDYTGQLVGMTQSSPPDYRERMIPRNKSLHFKTRSRRENPEGISLLRNAYRPWYMKKNIEAIEGIGIERDLAGLPVLWAPEHLFSQTASEEDKGLMTDLQKIVTSIKRDEQEGILMPMAYDEDGKNPLYKLELLSTGGDRQFDTNAIISRYDERIAMSMLADFILMGHQAVGSYALSTTKTGLFSTALSAIMDVIAEEVNQQAIPRLVLLNGWGLDLVPSLQHGKIETADVSKLGEFLKQLSDAGMQIFPNAELETHLLQMAGLPKDPGAGEMPLPTDEQLAAAGLSLVPLAPAVDPVTGLPTAPPTPTAPGAKPAARLPAGAPAAKPAVRPVARPAARPTSVPKAATEPVKNKHFTPLPVRVSKIQEALQEALDPQEYSEFLVAVLSAGKFTKLSTEYQDLIIEAESAG